MTKMTNKQALVIALDALNLVADQIDLKAEWTIDDVKAKISGLIAQYDRKKSSDKPTKIQQENEELMKVVLDTLAKIGPARATDIANSAGLSSGQKAAALLRKLVDEDKVIKLKGEKNVVLFSVKGE